MKTTRKLIALALVLAMVLAAGLMAGAESTEPLAAITEASTVCTSPFTEAVQKVHASVVGVNNYTTYTYSNNYGGYGNGNGNGWGSFFGFPFDFFGDGYGNGYGNGNNGNNGNIYGGSDSAIDEGKTQKVLQGYASGVVIARDFVITNYHVVEKATELEVVYEDKTYAAQLMGTDEAKDLAVMYVEGLEAEPVVLGDSDALNIGDWAICIGNAIGFEGTTTAGIISGLNREITGSSTDTYGKRTTNTMIQTDAAINSGNSGGGMFNVAGELIGIPCLKYAGSSSGTANIEGIAMAVPINQAKPLILDVLNGKGNVQASPAQASLTNASKPRIGVTMTQLNSSNYAVQNGLIPNGAYVTEVEAGAPADQAGIKVADIIVEVDGTVITAISQVSSVIQSHAVGDTITVKVYRVEGGLDKVTDYRNMPNGEYIDISVTLAAQDSNVQQ